jgi:hypothetical protein
MDNPNPHEIDGRIWGLVSGIPEHAIADAAHDMSLGMDFEYVRDDALRAALAMTLTAMMREGWHVDFWQKPKISDAIDVTNLEAFGG